MMEQFDKWKNEMKYKIKMKYEIMSTIVEFN